MRPAELGAAYREQLRDTLARSRAAWHIVPWQTRAMLAWMETHEGGCLGADQVARSWVWADLHLNHQAIIWSGQRPFRDATALLTAWNEMIREDELIVCLGDVTVGPPSSVIDEALAALPGTKFLVVGKHEFVNNRELPKDYGFEALYPTLVCECDPPLLLTHEPLEHVPAGCISVHGHLHGTAARTAAAGSSRHLNVNVEMIAYRPVRLAALAVTARGLLAGDVEPRRTTARTVTTATRQTQGACDRRGTKLGADSA